MAMRGAPILLRALVALGGAWAAAAVRSNATAALAGGLPPLRGRAVATVAAAIGVRTAAPRRSGGGGGGGLAAGPLHSKASGRFEHPAAPTAPLSAGGAAPEPAEVPQRPFDLESFERELDLRLESFRELFRKLHGAQRAEALGHDQRKHRSACTESEPDCEHDPQSKDLAPRAVHAQVVVVKQDEEGEYWVLLHRRALDSPGGGRLAVISGEYWEGWDEDSRAAALRGLVEEAGLLDGALLNGALWPYRDSAVEMNARVPLSFEVFDKSSHSDWWILVLQGPGAFNPRLASANSAEIGPLLARLHSWHLAPTPQFAWFRLDQTFMLARRVTTLGLTRRLREVHLYLTQADDKPEPLAPAPPKQNRRRSP